MVDAGHVERRLHDADAVGLVIDGEVAVKPQAIAVLPEHAHAKAVEGADPDPVAGQKLVDAPLHLAGSLVGEGDGEDRRGMHALHDQVGDPAGDDARLAAARPGQHQQRTFSVQDRFALGLGHPGQQGIEGAGCHATWTLP